MLNWRRFALLLKSRQIGASHTYAAAAVLWALLGETTTVISIGEREAIEFLEKCALHAKALEMLGSRWAKVERSSATVLKLASGGRIVALPATSGGRSYAGNVILDEFAYHQDPSRVWDGAGGTVMHGFKLRVLSTPNGVGNLFHELWSNPKAHDGYALHEVTLDDARAAGMHVDEAECWRMAHGDPRVYDQLFRCKFLDNEQQYIPSELIEAGVVDSAALLEGDCYGGLDIGRKNDRTVLVVVRVDDAGCHWVQAVESRKRTSEDDLHALVAFAFQSWGCRRLCVDATGLGAFPVERMQKTWGRHRVEAIDFTLRSKEDLATTLYQRLADKNLKYARAEKDLRDDIAAIRRIITSAGNVRYDAPATERGHADRAWALALSLHACSKPRNVRNEEYA